MAESITPITVTPETIANKQVISGLQVRMYRNAVTGNGDMSDCAVSVTVSRGTGDAPNFKELSSKEIAISKEDFLGILNNLGGMDVLLNYIKSTMIADGTWE